MTPAMVLPQMVAVEAVSVPRLSSTRLRDPRVVRLTGELVRQGSFNTACHAVVDHVIRAGSMPQGHRSHPPVDVAEYQPFVQWPVRLRSYADALRAELAAVERSLAIANALALEVVQ